MQSASVARLQGVSREKSVFWLEGMAIGRISISSKDFKGRLLEAVTVSLIKELPLVEE